MVIGARGFIGSWICRLLIEEGVRVTATDTSPDPRSMSSVLEPHHLEKMAYRVSDARSPEQVRDLIGADVTHIIYLAGILRPASENNPLLSSQVSIGGLINVLDATVRRGNGIGVVYSSTAAVYGPASDYPDGLIDDKSRPMPRDHYGLHRYAMELTADAYYRQHGLASLGLRPWVVYGAGRFNGLSAQPSLAMLAAAAGAPFHMQFGGMNVFQHVRDVALAFIRGARARLPAAMQANIPGESVVMDDLISIIERCAPESRGAITCERNDLGSPRKLNDPRLEKLIGPLPSPTEDRVRETIIEYRRLLADGRISPP
ncbi:MAG: NAD(P)-dependent oxidoreductase [Xanthobacteraceae bacterium]|nr:NAD(P)-dependent oxidoreductase [Xanthobacteraceae bacterium]